jgi:hypothetical protein
MNSEAIKEYILDFQSRDTPKLTERELKIDGPNRIKTVIGPRRAGKTYLLYQKMKGLLKEGVRKENMLYLNFEDPRLMDVNFKEVREILKLHWQLYPQSASACMHIFVDEPQNMKNWETAVRALHDEGFNVYLSGSSSKLLSREIATSLRGRSFSYTLLPCSFREFLRMRNAAFDVQRLGSREKALLLNLLDEYIEFGGFPEVVLESSVENKLRILGDYFDLIVYRDVVERYRIKNIMAIKWLIKTLAGSFSREFSVHKTYSTLKSRGVKVSKNTLYSYRSMLEESFFVFFAPRFEHSENKREFSINKAYLCDLGFARVAETTGDRGRKMENAVFLELERRKTPLTTVSYWKNQQHEEVDFAVKAGSRMELMQACIDVSDPDVKKRETNALLKAGRELSCNRLSVITYDYEAIEKIKNKKIRFIPLWKWLLS